MAEGVGMDSGTTELRDALDALDAAPGQETYERACRAADAFVDANLGRPGARRVTAEFVEHGPTLLARFSDWALLVVVAFHEAGHAVASWALGQRPTGATIIPAEQGDHVILGSVLGGPVPIGFGRDDPEASARVAAMIALAGDIAEQPFASTTAPGARARRWFAKRDAFTPGRGAGTDSDVYSIAAYEQGGVGNMEPWLAFWHGETVELLQRHAGKVEAVALALLRHRELGEEDLADLLGPMPGRER